ncbi:GTP-binding protein [Acinetobacter sp. A3.8]|uniref:GTP-binding protein n=1 Tax=Acinetobacter sedimenti TaxID=2919922 RepID=A0A9X1WZ95_9GAMM|nr:GTP-binding protein [Acinetobacter sedimenti]MCJ8147333.1 GTP-binding protein [Acinetobacter sedimenti]
MNIIQAVPTHIITGFLGAGKTTVLRHLLTQKPKNEVWAVLMNEFGEIGVDQTWIAEHQGIAVKEVLGGCLCCTSQLPMQIALARLLSEFKPTRLFIEPTGLGHPKELIDQLSESNWQSSLNIRQVITVIDGHRLHEQLWQKHEIFLQQLDVADLVLVSCQSEMNADDQLQLKQLQDSYQFPPKLWKLLDHGEISLQEIDQSRIPKQIKKQPLLSQQLLTQNMPRLNGSDFSVPKTLPYHYSSEQQGFFVAGWHMPKSWQFDTDALIRVLQAIQGFVRIKAKLHTTDGWIDINAISTNFQVDFATKAALDNRLEIISEVAQDWLAIEKQLLLLSGQTTL